MKKVFVDVLSASLLFCLAFCFSKLLAKFNSLPISVSLPLSISAIATIVLLINQNWRLAGLYSVLILIIGVTLYHGVLLLTKRNVSCFCSQIFYPTAIARLFIYGLVLMLFNVTAIVLFKSLTQVDAEKPILKE